MSVIARQSLNWRVVAWLEDADVGPVVVVAPGAVQSVLSGMTTAESEFKSSVAELFVRIAVVVKPLGLVVFTVKMLDVAVNDPGVRLGRFWVPESITKLSEGDVGVAVTSVDVAMVMLALS